jgi:hypothetical protein
MRAGVPTVALGRELRVGAGSRGTDFVLFYRLAKGKVGKQSTTPNFAHEGHTRRTHTTKPTRAPEAAGQTHALCASQAARAASCVWLPSEGGVQAH